MTSIDGSNDITQDFSPKIPTAKETKAIQLNTFAVKAYKTNKLFRDIIDKIREASECEGFWHECEGHSTDTIEKAYRMLVQLGYQVEVEYKPYYTPKTIDYFNIAWH